jgi:hypothetical protein
VYVYPRSGATWHSATQTSQFTDPAGASANDLFSESLAQSGTAIVTGTAIHASRVGTAVVFAPPRPAITAARQSHKTWALGTAKPKLNPKRTPKGGTEFSFTVNEPTSVSLAFAERLHGHARSKGKLIVHAKQGHNVVYLDGKTGGGRRLSAGKCTVTVSATNTNGSSSHATLHFTTIKAKNARK